MSEPFEDAQRRQDEEARRRYEKRAAHRQSNIDALDPLEGWPRSTRPRTLRAGSTVSLATTPASRCQPLRLRYQRLRRLPSR